MKALGIVLAVLGLIAGIVAAGYGITASGRLIQALTVADSLDRENLVLDSLNTVLARIVAEDREEFEVRDSIAQVHRQTDELRVGELRTAANMAQVLADRLEAEIRATLSPEDFPTLDRLVEVHRQQLDSLSLALDISREETLAERDRGNAAVRLIGPLTEQVESLTEQKNLEHQANLVLRQAIDEARVTGVIGQIKAAGPITLIGLGVIVLVAL